MEFRLEENEPVKLYSGSFGVTVRCSRGYVWLTDGSSRDRILTSGGSCFIEKDSCVVIESLSDGAVSLEYPASVKESSTTGSPVMISARAAALHA